jgi:HAD superfamily hydrolase (TIGR01490 family)
VARKFAVFDIDGTVIRWQLFHSVVSELIVQGHIAEQAAQDIETARSTWKNRADTDSFHTYEHVLVKKYFAALSDLPIDAYQSAVQTVFDEYKDQVYTYTRDLIKKLKGQGYLLFAISGSQQEIVSKFAEYYGFDDAIGAQLEQVDGHFTGNFVSPAHHGKQTALDTLIERHKPDSSGSIAVGDTESDAVLLSAVERPIAFNPSAGLFAMAKQHGWTVVVERKNVVYELEPRGGQYILA